MKLTGRKVQIWILKEHKQGHKILLLRTTPIRGSFWQPVTGHVRPSETWEQAARREVREETGVRLGRGALRYTGHEFEFRKGTRKFRERVFVAIVQSPIGPILVDPDEHDLARWESERVAKNRTGFKSNLRGLKNALEII